MSESRDNAKKRSPSTLAALLKEKPKRGRPPRAVSRQNVYVALSAQQKSDMSELAEQLPEYLSRADLPDLAITILAARLEAFSLLQQGAKGEVDLEHVLVRVAEARDALVLVSKIEKGLNQAENGLNSSRATAGDLRKQLNVILDQLENAVRDQKKGAA